MAESLLNFFETLEGPTLDAFPKEIEGLTRQLLEGEGLS